MGIALVGRYAFEEIPVVIGWFDDWNFLDEL